MPKYRVCIPADLMLTVQCENEDQVLPLVRKLLTDCGVEDGMDLDIRDLQDNPLEDARLYTHDEEVAKGYEISDEYPDEEAT